MATVKVKKLVTKIEEVEVNVSDSFMTRWKEFQTLRGLEKKAIREGKHLTPTEYARMSDLIHQNNEEIRELAGVEDFANIQDWIINHG